MISKIIFLGFWLAAFTATGLAQGFIYADNEEEHQQKVEAWRMQKDEDYKDPEKTMLTEELMADFSALNYYPIAYSYRVTGKLTRFDDGRVFTIETTGGQQYEYLVYARVSFILNETPLTLTVFQGKRAAKSGQKRGALFIPFTDNTSGAETFGGGRYLVLDLPEDNNLVLDFNMAYNPYCLYNESHSCPIPPRENHLDTEVKAGELLYP